MQKVCRNCHVNFEIYQEDLDFLGKIGSVSDPQVEIPPPTLCPECRQRRRMSFRNERNLFHRKCDVTGKDIISIFPPTSKQKVCEKDYWYGEQFEPLHYGRDYNFSKPFFEQFQELLHDIPLPSLRVEKSENCDFNSDMSDCKNCYLCARTHRSSDILYTYRGNKSTSCVDCYQAVESELLYECVEAFKCYDSKFLNFCTNCVESAFLVDCRNCTNCFMCFNLRNKRYCFNNEQLTKEEYEGKMRAMSLGSYQMLEWALGMFEKIKKQAIKRNLTLNNAEDSYGENLLNTKNCFYCFDVKNIQDGRYLWNIIEYKDAMDAYTGGRGSELIYEATSTSGCYNAKFCVRAVYSNDVNYSMFLRSCKNVFGSVGLQNNSFCILNKQYSEEKYRELLPKIIEHMQQTGEWGEFFPFSLSPFAYNHTVAYEYFPCTKEEALEKGYNWSDYESPPPKADRVIEADKIPDNISQVTDEILKSAIKCKISGKPFKIVPQELEFYQKQTIAVPRISPDERHKRRFNSRNLPRLRKSKCMRCGKEIETSYTLGTENIYCNACYDETLR